MSTIKDKVLEMLTAPMTKIFEEEGLTSKYLAKKLKSELNYKEPLEQVITEGTGRSKKTKRVVKGVKSPAAMQIRQKARESAHRLLSHYPPEKREFAGPGGAPLGAGAVDPRPIKVVFVSPGEAKE